MGKILSRIAAAEVSTDFLNRYESIAYDIICPLCRSESVLGLVH